MSSVLNAIVMMVALIVFAVVFLLYVVGALHDVRWIFAMAALIVVGYSASGKIDAQD